MDYRRLNTTLTQLRKHDTTIKSQNVGHGVIILWEEEIDITEDNIPEDKSFGNFNKQDDEDETSDTRDNADGGTDEVKYDKVVRTPNDNNDNNENGKNTI